MLVLRGCLAHCPTYGALQVLEDHVIVVDEESGDIVALVPGEEAAVVLAEQGLVAAQVLRLPPTAFLLPGLVDCHLHAPQYPFTGTATVGGAQRECGLPSAAGGSLQRARGRLAQPPPPPPCRTPL